MRQFIVVCLWLSPLASGVPSGDESLESPPPFQIPVEHVQRIETAFSDFQEAALNVSAARNLIPLEQQGTRAFTFLDQVEGLVVNLAGSGSAAVEHEQGLEQESVDIAYAMDVTTLGAGTWIDANRGGDLQIGLACINNSMPLTLTVTNMVTEEVLASFPMDPDTDADIGVTLNEPMEIRIDIDAMDLSPLIRVRCQLRLRYQRLSREVEASDPNTIADL